MLEIAGSNRGPGDYVPLQFSLPFLFVVWTISSSDSDVWVSSLYGALLFSSSLGVIISIIC